MIETSVYAVWILEQSLYWSFLRLQTETMSDESWKACLRTVSFNASCMKRKSVPHSEEGLPSRRLLTDDGRSY